MAASFREQLPARELVELYDYWDWRRQGRRMPGRQDIDPLDIPRHLPNLMLIDVLREPLRYRYRLVGTRVVAASAEDRTGRLFGEVEFFEKNPTVMEQYGSVVATGEPMHSLEPFRNFINDSTYQVDRLLLPLASDGERVDMILVYFLFRSGPFAKG